MKIERRHVTMADGLRMYTEFCSGNPSALPLLCLPGLTRNHRDFEPVLQHFGGQRPIITMDFRGRGLSDPAPDPKTYRPDVELADTLAVLDAWGVEKVALLGTSRGGIVGILMAASHPQRLVGICLNDIGPQLEPQGLLRIMGYVGVRVSFDDWTTAAQSFANAQHGFSNVPLEAWIAAARRVYVEQDERIVPDYDMQLAATLPSVEDVKAGKLPSLWPVIGSLAGKPVLSLRGEGSDLLSQATVMQMMAALPGAKAVTVYNRGHCPFLDEPECISSIAAWLADCDAAPPPAR